MALNRSPEATEKTAEYWYKSFLYK